jgi:hypothetical protein
VFGPDGLLLLAPLPGGRWLSFQDLEEAVETVSAEEVIARIELRLGGRWRPVDVSWFSPFRMHRRIVSRLTDGRRFLIGGRKVPVENVDPVAAALQRNARAMLDVDYAGSPLVNDYAENGSGLAEPHPGQRYPDCTRFGGTSHHLLVFGPVAQAEGLAGLGRRWAKCVEISYNPDVRRECAGLLTDGVILIRPDGNIGFRFPTAERRSARGTRPPPLRLSDSRLARRSILDRKRHVE